MVFTYQYIFLFLYEVDIFPLSPYCEVDLTAAYGSSLWVTLCNFLAVIMACNML